tara:strand:- start:6057 stop:6308 length:252 start_codon:yes stop_codon:yes gene_type:complete
MGLVTAIKGLGKAYIAHKKTKKADKLYQSQRTDKYSGNVTDPDTIKLNKQLKTAKKIGAGAVGTLGAATIAGKIKQENKEKKK